MQSSDNDSDMQALDELWRRRHQASECAAFDKKIQEALAAAPEYPVLWRASRLAHFRAMQSESAGQAGEALRFFEAARAHAQHAQEFNRHDVEGHFWVGVNSLEWSRRKGWMHAASTLRAAEAAIMRAMNQDETYHFAGPVRVAARIMHLKPLLLGGSLDRAIDTYRRALQIAPHNSTTLLYYSEALLADQQKKTAREVLHQIINAPDDADWLWEQVRDRLLAKEHLSKMDAAR